MTDIPPGDRSPAGGFRLLRAGSPAMAELALALNPDGTAPVPPDSFAVVQAKKYWGLRIMMAAFTAVWWGVAVKFVFGGVFPADGGVNLGHLGTALLWAVFGVGILVFTAWVWRARYALVFEPGRLRVHDGWRWRRRCRLAFARGGVETVEVHHAIKRTERAHRRGTRTVERFGLRIVPRDGSAPVELSPSLKESGTTEEWNWIGAIVAAWADAPLRRPLDGGGREGGGHGAGPD